MPLKPLRNVLQRFLQTISLYHSTIKTKFNDVYNSPSFVSFREHVWPKVSAIILIVVGIIIAETLEENHAFLDLRYLAYEINQNMTARLKGDLWDHNTVVVLIGDEEFWKQGSYARRTPINYKKLAELMSALDQLGPKVIAVDFDFASPMPDGSIVQHEDYKEETKILASTIQEIAARRSVVLPKTLGWDAESFLTESDVYDDFKSELARVHYGYILPTTDYRAIPLRIPVKDKDRPYLDSLSQTIVGAFDLTGKARQWGNQGESVIYAGGFLYEDQFEKYYANEIIGADNSKRDELAQKIGCRIVIIGAAWSQYGYGRGDRVDSVNTPVGSIPGVFLHANWVESTLESRTAKPLGKWSQRSLEFLFGIAAYFFFTRRIWWVWKLVISVVGILGFWLGIAYLSFQTLNIFIDPVTPSLIGFAKATFEQVNHWRKDANKWGQAHHPIDAATADSYIQTSE